MIALLSGCAGKKNNLNTGLIPVKSNDKWGYVDKEGKYIINPQFSYADYFINGIALVKSNDNKYGFINEKGEYLINPQYKNAMPFSENMACVISEGCVPKYINKKGDILFEVPTAEQAGNFHNGFARIKNKDNKWGFVDNTGNIKINCQYDGVNDFNEGMAAVMNINKKDTTKTFEEWGYINEKGEMIINFQFKDASPFIESLARITLDYKQYGYIDTKGKMIINPQFDATTIFTDGLAPFRSGKLWGFIDKTGKIKINPQFDEVGLINNKLIPVRSGEKWGYIDKEGKIVINPQFDDALSFLGDIAMVKSSDKWGFIDKSGKYIVNPQFEDINRDILTYLIIGSDWGNIVVSDKIPPVEEIAEKFLTFLNRKDYDEARKLGTENTKQMLDMMKSFAGAAAKPTVTKDVKIENLKCDTNNDKARCTYTAEGKLESIDLVKQDNKWLVDMKKEGGGNNASSPGE